MAKMKPWSELEGQPIRFDVNSTTEEAMNAENPSTVHFTKDGRVVMNGCILGDKNPNRGKWDGRVVVNRAIPEFPRAGMAYFFSDGVVKIRFRERHFEKNQEGNIKTIASDAMKYYLMQSDFKDIDDDGIALKKEFREYMDHGIVAFYKTIKGGYFLRYPCIVHIDKDGSVFDDGVLRIDLIDVDSFCNETTSPLHYIEAGKVYYTKIPNINRAYEDGYSTEFGIHCVMNRHRDGNKQLIGISKKVGRHLKTIDGDIIGKYYATAFSTQLGIWSKMWNGGNQRKKQNTFYLRCYDKRRRKSIYQLAFRAVVYTVDGIRKIGTPYKILIQHSTLSRK